MPSLKILILGVAGTLVSLGLAILGAGGFMAFFSNPSRTAAAILTVVLMVVALFSSANLSPGEQEDRANRWVLPALGVIGLLSAFLPAYDDRIDFWTIGGETIRWIGVALFAAGGMLRLWPFFVLGSRFSGLVAIQPGHRLVTSGIYALIRHPSYLGLLVNALGWALVFRSGVGVILVGLTLVPLVARIRSEELLLRTHFGAEYDDYARRTWRLVPGLY
ncbi:isoprenylcysteine carboxylmethyltransferase family protein [Aminobacter sp. SR38]|jgi:protein-S-isoprenylcysteine O-methyltransferase Ste14|uniref:methyltransferase family protein n=1 Tax=Aminobacter sp. SR38 TaxID=2774562 RepID=UPI00177B4C17|nr:isoprenylcysteine carboxylmethyltransferase family protein [Aminobacter sp. SR38]QOF70705.1 isoprenylcysteine carboxylmethyltransferase family protein [Aminobacter sp. SR38]